MQKGKTQNYDYTKHISDSQNFLTKRQLIRKILNLSSITADDIVLEIGAGKGHLTEALCQVSGLVYSVEIDRKLYEHTRTKLSHLTNLKLIHGDFLKLSLPARGDYKVFANIPYFITTQIMDKLTNASNPPTDIWLIMEKGAARRFTGIPKETARSLLLKVKWESEILYHFHREDFHPMPSVDSVLLHLKRKAVPDLPANCIRPFEICGAFHEIRALHKTGPAHQKTGFHRLKACRPAPGPQRRHHAVYPVAVLISMLSWDSGQILTDCY